MEIGCVMVTIFGSAGVMVITSESANISATRSLCNFQLAKRFGRNVTV